MGKISAEERALIDAAVSRGQVTRCPAVVEVPRRGACDAVEPAGGSATFGGPPPRPVRRMSVQAAIEWAFGTEHAQIDADPIGDMTGGRRGFGLEFVLMERATLGVGTIDRSPGRSSPADDAEMIAAAVQAVLRLEDAIQLAEYARAGRAPDAMIGARPRCVPVTWHRNPHGLHGKLEELPRERYEVRGRLRSYTPTVVPVTYAPTWSQIGRARRHYLDWYGWLLKVGGMLRSTPLSRIQLTDEMPPLTPWQDKC